MTDTSLTTIEQGDRPLDSTYSADENQNTGNGAVAETTETTTTTTSPPAGNDNSVDAQASLETTEDAAPQTIVWSSINSFDGNPGLSEAIQNFVDMKEDGTLQQPSPDTLNGRTKNLIFNFKHTPNPNEFEIGTFQIVLAYPASAGQSGASGTGAASSGELSSSTAITT